MIGKILGLGPAFVISLAVGTSRAGKTWRSILFGGNCNNVLPGHDPYAVLHGGAGTTAQWGNGRDIADAR